jgi:DNA-binding NtrC family response regulator
VISGPDKGLRAELLGESLLIGSSSECDLVLHDGTVSGRHAEVQSTREGYFIRDLGSRNGILLGGYPISRVPLCNGMRLELGETTVAVKSLGQEFAIPLAASGDVGGLVARSLKMRAFVASLSRYAAEEITVLIEGESGAGKEMAAEALHQLSRRRSGPWVVFDCSAVVRTLAAAELFGYERGAFTGADQSRAGLLEQAEEGTLFLDEIGELPLEVQPMLLGALERKRSRSVGGKVDRVHDVRIVAATNRNLSEEVRAKRFREDLYHRLAVAKLRVPPLRERPEDIPVLADRFAIEMGAQLAPQAVAPLQAYEWPGNVRELKNTVTRLIVNPESTDIPRPKVEKPPAPPPSELNPALVASLCDRSGQLRPWLEARRLAAAEAERSYVAAVLAQADGNLTHAAQLAGITRQSLTVLAEKHGLRSRG